MLFKLINKQTDHNVTNSNKLIHRPTELSTGQIKIKQKQY